MCVGTTRVRYGSPWSYETSISFAWWTKQVIYLVIQSQESRKQLQHHISKDISDNTYQCRCSQFEIQTARSQYLLLWLPQDLAALKHRVSIWGALGPFIPCCCGYQQSSQLLWMSDGFFVWLHHTSHQSITIIDMINMVINGCLCCRCDEKMAMHTVHVDSRGNSEHGCREGLGDESPSVYSTGSRGMP